MSRERTTSIEKFRKLTEDLQKECLATAKSGLSDGADRLVRTMKAACPVEADPPPSPGLLRDSIAWTFGKPPPTKATGAFRPAPSQTNAFTATVYAGNDKAYYARWVEFGTHSHSLSKGADISRKKTQAGSRQHPGSVAHPFFWPSYRLLIKPMRRSVKSKLAAAIRKRSAAT